MSRRWQTIKNHILGKRFDLSVVFTGNPLMKRLNTTYRGKSETTNVLSFPLSDNSGEVFINKVFAKKDAKRLSVEFDDYMDYLFIHCLLHLKGYKHSKEMELAERENMKKFKINIIWQET
jgi:probable rRNA maturation factor